MKENKETAQEILNSCNTEDERDNLKLFYPTIWAQKKANENLTLILAKLKGGFF